jgi:pimeloyl-ACP methyl ester carboxylesterase
VSKDTAPATDPMAPWPELAPSGRFVTTGGRESRTFLFDSGKSGESGGPRSRGPLVCLIHGLGDEADTWRQLWPLLARRHRVIALDLPGFGRSPPSGRVTLASCAETVVQLLGAVSTGPSILAGSSVGAVIAELAAFRSPSLVGALVLIDGGLPQVRGTVRAMLPMLVPFSGERIYTSFRDNHDAAYASLQPYYADLTALPEADRRFLKVRVIDRVHSDKQRRAYFSLLRSLALWDSFRSGYFRWNLAAWRKPLLLAWGAEDRIIPRATADMIAALVPHAAKAVIPGAGHLPQQEKPGELAAEMERFISSL